MLIAYALLTGLAAATAIKWGIAPLFPSNAVPTHRRHGGPVSTLPRRTPGVTLLRDPPRAGIHVNPVPHCPLLLRLATFTVNTRHRARVFVRDWVLESDESFACWWSETLDIQRRRQEIHGRHRYDEMCRDPRWRTRWALYETQEWPTLSIDGHGWSINPEPLMFNEDLTDIPDPVQGPMPLVAVG